MKQVLRREVKYEITLPQYYNLSHKLAKLMQEDKHNGISGYQVRSLYFDTLNSNDFYEKEFGIDLRRKIRIRTYSPDGKTALLEMKQKQGTQQRKRSCLITKEMAEECIKGNYSALLQHESQFAVECYGLMSRQFYRPKTIVEYTRKAFVAKENNIRITFDRNIRASQSYLQMFSNEAPFKPIMPPEVVILEVKYDGFLLSYIKNLISEVNASPISAGKYSASRL